VVLESMACGVPVIATDIADNALILDDASGGSVVPSTMTRHVRSRESPPRGRGGAA